MTAFPRHRPGRASPVSEAAAQWALRQEGNPLDDTEARAFAEWLAEDESHVAAYQDALWALDATARHAGEREMLALRSAALAAGSKGRRYRGWAAGLAAAATMVAAVGITLTPPATNPLIGKATRVAERTFDRNHILYRTGIGERSAITLPDGSIVTLDTDSQIQVAYGPRERGVHLLRGQALFDVAHGKPAPFQVYAGRQRITAVGTKFNVRIEGAQVRVAMVEGSVKVRAVPRDAEEAAAPISEMTLAAGEGLVAEPARPSIVRTIDATHAPVRRGCRDEPLHHPIDRDRRRCGRQLPDQRRVQIERPRPFCPGHRRGAADRSDLCARRIADAPQPHRLKAEARLFCGDPPFARPCSQKIRTMWGRGS
jgi:transmembrane sensor